MRKVLVAGAAVAATCLSAVAVPAGAQAEPPAPKLTEERSSSTTTTPPSPPARSDSSVVSARAVIVTPKPPSQRTYAYGRHPRQRVDVYWRAASKSRKQARKQPARPGVLLLHGGSWRGGSKTGWKYFARRLTTQGFTVFAADYRLSGMAHWPAQRTDAQAALAFVKKHARSWNVDPRRIVVVGASAGGHLATQLGTVGTGAGQVRGVAALSPVNTPYLAYQDGIAATASRAQSSLRGAVIKLLGCVPSQASPACWERVDDANSATHASRGDAPMLLVHSQGDFVPVTQSTGLASALRGVGVPVRVKTVPGDLHGNGLMNDETVYPELLSWIRSRTR
ncbi:alpha/beta hydrolase [Actinomadura fulvescens]|uniref:BD-FAE-like domain-containing protein n=1 Tax=Actinomadura fulvescens TaxID=46160 RepID=A0ABN3PWZ8_9ACTN